MIRVVLADDELLARQKLRILLQSAPQIVIVGEASTPTEALDLVRTLKPDLLFLDIRMPGVDGFGLLERLTPDFADGMPLVVFTTAYDEYALKAFDVNAVDYLLKPFTEDRLQTALQRVTQQLRSREEAPDSLGRAATLYSPRIVFKSRGRIVFLPVSSILWIAAEENYVRICTEGETHLLRETMTHLEGKLDPLLFLRVHRSAIVNLQYVKEVRTEQDGENVVVLQNGQRISMGRTYRSRLNELLLQS